MRTVLAPGRQLSRLRRRTSKEAKVSAFRFKVIVFLMRRLITAQDGSKVCFKERPIASHDSKAFGSYYLATSSAL